MKKLGIYFMMLAMTAVVFVGCNKDEEKDPAAPVITMPSKITFDEENPGALEVKVAVTSADEDLTSIEVYVMYNEAFKFPILEVTDFGANPKAWAKTFTAADFPIEQIAAVEGSLVFWVEAKATTTDAKESAVIEIIKAPVPDPLLGEAKTFKFIYHSQGHANNVNPPAETGLGLTWFTTTAGPVSATIRGSIVELSKTEFEAIKTQKALKDKYDAVITPANEIKVVLDPHTAKYFITKSGTTYSLVETTGVNINPPRELTISYRQ